ncbi:MAG: hypothetical protein ABIB04_00705 [Patescibacteria group bacterium]
MKRALFFTFFSLVLSTACGPVDETESQPLAPEPDKTYICRLGEACDDVRIWCRYDPSTPGSGLMTCDGEELVSTCKEGYYCFYDGSTPDYYPSCLAKDGEILDCDPETRSLHSREDGG